MLNKTEQRYVKSLLKEKESQLNYFLTNSRSQENRNEKHIQQLENKLEMNTKIINKLDV